MAAVFSVAGLGAAAACSSAKDEATARPDASADTGGPAPGDGGGGEDAASGPSFCTTLSPAPFFCADFDDGAAPDAIFAEVSGAPKNEDQALRVATDGAEAFVAQKTDPSPPWAHIEVGFSLRFEALSNDARITIARIGQHDTDAECRVELELRPDALTLVSGGGDEAALTASPAKGSALRIVVSMDAAEDGGGVAGSVTVDGKAGTAAPLDLGCARLPGPPRVTLGRISGGGSADLRFDDVVFDGR